MAEQLEKKPSLHEVVREKLLTMERLCQTMRLELLVMQTKPAEAAGFVFGAAIAMMKSIEEHYGPELDSKRIFAKRAAAEGEIPEPEVPPVPPKEEQQ